MRSKERNLDNVNSLRWHGIKSGLHASVWRSIAVERGFAWLTENHTFVFYQRWWMSIICSHRLYAGMILAPNSTSSIAATILYIIQFATRRPMMSHCKSSKNCNTQIKQYKLHSANDFADPTQKRKNFHKLIYISIIEGMWIFSWNKLEDQSVTYLEHTCKYQHSCLGGSACPPPCAHD